MKILVPRIGIVHNALESETGTSREIHMFRLAGVIAALALGSTVCSAQDAGGGVLLPPAHRWLLLVCGLPGDEEHERNFADTSRDLLETLTDHYDFAADHTYFIAGGDGMLGIVPSGTHADVASRDEVLATLRSLSTSITPRDELWVIVIGHASEQQQRVLLQLPGADLSTEEFADACREIPARRQLFILTTAASGSFIQPLAKPGRIVLSATEASAEPNETDYPLALVRTLKKFVAETSDSAKAPTVLDLHNAVARDVLSGYLSRGHLPTEHALLDDNSDGKGAEVQLRSLPIELGGDLDREAAGPHPFKPHEDGYRASFAPLGLRGALAEPAAPKAN